MLGSDPTWNALRAAVREDLAIRRPLAGARAPEVRRNEDGTLDEVVANNCAFHLEQLSDGQWWMSVQAGGVDVRVTLYTQRGAKIMANVHE